MEAFCIVIKNNTTSEHGYKILQETSLSVKNDFDISRYDATIPDQIEMKLAKYKLKWNYPIKGSILDPWSELRKSAYGEVDHRKRIACSLSHFELWIKCIEKNEPILILEHDSQFIRKLDYSNLIDSKYGVIGINDPKHTTFSYSTYDYKIQSKRDEIQEPPVMASKEIPQGLPGNSAYLIKPFAAKHLVQLCYKYGLWPNDAIMCKQLCDFLAVSKTYYTEVQNLPSTTSL